ncbi:hydroxymethylpyrimidine/phosphomethylpyrimidine kinase [Cycloclasticus sp. 44_32_T64]|nr:hydroxymethylpyrimidine/phosphomethylpyrimidine kinase [Cycloclasticus sp. 44_32_T64]
MPYSSKKTALKPIVLSLSGHDPTGGAGIQADAEALVHFGCHPCSILTCLTVQDSSTVHRLIPLDAAHITEQANALFNDMPIAVIKIGLTGSVNVVNAIVEILKSHPDIPVVFDPVLACGDGTSLANTELIHVIKDTLIPLATVLTPNTVEAAQLSGRVRTTSTAELGLDLLAQGAHYVLITGGHESTATIKNSLFHDKQIRRTSVWPRQAGEFHGTGCTLASAIAALMAKGHAIADSIELAQEYVDKAIKQAHQLGRGQAFPDRSQQ